MFAVVTLFLAFTKTDFLYCLQLINWFLLNLTENNVFAVLLLNYAVFSLFALNKDFCLFAANHTDSSYISLKRTFFAVLVLNYAVFSLKKKRKTSLEESFRLVAGNYADSSHISLIRTFLLFCCQVTLFSALSHQKPFFVLVYCCYAVFSFLALNLVFLACLWLIDWF